MAKLSIDVTNKLRSGLFLLSALSEQGPTVANRVQASVLPDHEDGNEPPHFLTQLQAFAQLLRTALDRMVERDRLLVDENDQRASLLQARDADASRLKQRTGGLRRIIIGGYAEPDAANLGLVGSFSREPVALLRQAELVCKRLQSDDLDKMLGESLFEPAIDPRPLAEQIEPDIEAVHRSVEAHNRSKRRVDQLLAEKKQMVKSYDTIFVRVARQFEDLCRLAGEDDLANKVRPSTRRPGQTEEPVSVEAPDADVEERPAEAEAPPEGQAVSVLAAA